MTRLRLVPLIALALSLRVEYDDEAALRRRQDDDDELVDDLRSRVRSLAEFSSLVCRSQFLSWLGKDAGSFGDRSQS